MTKNKTFKVTCTETTSYEFSVNATNEAEALRLAKRLLLGDDEGIGAIRFAWPDDKTLSIAVDDRDWEVTTADEDARDAIDDATVEEFVAPYPMDSGLLFTERYVRNRLEDAFECDDVEDFLTDEEASLDDDEAEDLAHERRLALTDRIVFAMREKSALKKMVAEAIWDGSEESSTLQNVIDGCVADFADEFVERHGRIA